MKWVGMYMYEIYQNEIFKLLKGEKDSFPLRIAVTKILCEDLPLVVLKQCDELELININMTASPGLGCLKADKKE